MNRIKEIRRAKGMTQAQVAHEFGIDVGNYNKLENGRTNLTEEKMNRLAQILGCAPTDLLAPVQGTRTVQVLGWVQAGDWAESHIWDDAQRYTVAIPYDAEFEGVALAGVETRGPSMNKRYPEGTVLVYANIFHTREPLADGKRYVIERERADGKRETTVKKLLITENGKKWLMPESDDPMFQQPIAVEGAEGDQIRVLGRVVYSVQRED